jgi:3-oxoadipate enol-lactonase
MERRRVEELELTVDGKPARVHAGGDGEPLVLVHGAWGGAAMHWSPVWERLAARFQVIAPELPGIGWPGQQGLGSVGAYARWLEGVLDELSVPRACFVGHSLGAAIAWRFAAQSPARCRGLALVNGTPSPRASALLAWARRPSLARDLLRAGVRAPALEAVLEVLSAGDRGAPPALAPLIVWGEADRVSRRGVDTARALHAKLPGSGLALVAGAGHMPQVERPDAFVEVIAPWAASIGAGPAAPRPRRRRAARGATAGLASVRNGELFYEMRGEGPPLVLLHAGFLDHRLWDAQVETFARVHKVIRYDARGHGRSSTPAHAFCHYEDLRDLLVQLGVPRASLVGLALGSRTALDFALAYPHAVEALVLASPGMSGEDFQDPFVLRQLEAMRASAAARDGKAVVEAFLRAWVDGPRRGPGGVDPALRERLRAMAVDNFAKFAAARGKVRELGAKERLEDLRVPLLAIVGELDAPDIHRIADVLATRVPGARKAVVAGAGHTLNLESAPAFDRAVLEFLARV